MTIDIRKDGQLFGPHTVEELKELVSNGDVAPSDTVIKELGEEVSVGEFLTQSRPLKLKLLAPAVPEKPLTPAPTPSSGIPPMLAASRVKKPPTEAEALVKPAGHLVWIAVVVGLFCVWLTYKHLVARPGVESESALVAALGQTAGAGAAITLLIKVVKRNVRTPREICLGLIIGFGLRILFDLMEMSS